MTECMSRISLQVKSIIMWLPGLCYKRQSIPADRTHYGCVLEDIVIITISHRCVTALGRIWSSVPNRKAPTVCN